MRDRPLSSLSRSGAARLGTDRPGTAGPSSGLTIPSGSRGFVDEGISDARPVTNIMRTMHADDPNPDTEASLKEREEYYKFIKKMMVSVDFF